MTNTKIQLHCRTNWFSGSDFYFRLSISPKTRGIPFWTINLWFPIIIVNLIMWKNTNKYTTACIVRYCKIAENVHESTRFYLENDIAASVCYRFKKEVAPFSARKNIDEKKAFQNRYNVMNKIFERDIISIQSTKSYSFP